MLVSTRLLQVVWGLCCVLVASPVIAQDTVALPAKAPVSLASRICAQPFQSLIDDVILSQPCQQCGKQNKNRCCDDCGETRRWTWTEHRVQPIERAVDQAINEADQLVRNLQADQPSQVAGVNPVATNVFNEQLSDLLLLSLKANPDDSETQRRAIATALRLAQEHGRSQSSRQLEERLDCVTSQLVQLKRDRPRDLGIDIAPKYSQPIEESNRQLLGPEQQRANLKSLTAAVELLESKNRHREIRNQHFHRNHVDSGLDLHERELASQLDQISSELRRLQSNFRQWSQNRRAYRLEAQPTEQRYAELQPVEHRSTAPESSGPLPKLLRSLKQEPVEGQQQRAKSMKLQPLYQTNDPLQPID